VEIIRALLRLGILYLLFVIDYDKLILLSSLGFCVTLYYVLSLYIKARQYPEAHHKICRDQDLIKRMLNFISLLIVTVLAEMLRKQGLIMLINLFFGLMVNAAYAVAMQISTMVSTFVVNIKQPIIPQMMGAYGAGDKKNMFRLISFGTKITCLMMLILSLPIIFEIDWILDFWLKTPPEHTSILVILVLININISSFTYFLYQGVHATGNIKVQQIWISSLYVASVAAVYLAFKLGAGFSSALYICIITSVIQCFVNLFCAKKYYGYGIRQFVFKTVLPCAMVAAVVSGVLWGITFLFSSTIIRAVCVFVIGVLLCCGLGYQFVLNPEEKTQAVTMLRKLIKK
jgi:O-antigen/teichoic acid export membrane protein